MNALKLVVSLALAFNLVANPLRAEDDYDFMQPAAVRLAYETAQSDWQPLPDLVANAFLVAADKDFRDRATGRSVITSQLAQRYLAERLQRPTFQRSFPATLGLGMALSHDEILNWYVHGIDLGQNCEGVDAAARVYFGKDTADLRPHEAALLAAIMVSPTRYRPDRNPDRATERRNAILQDMAEAGFISATEASSAQSRPLSVTVPLGRCASKQG